MPLFYINGQLRGNPEAGLDMGFEVMVTLDPRPQWTGDIEKLTQVLVPYLEAHPELLLWQLGNEPDLALRGMEPNAVQYVDFFVQTSGLIRKHRPEATLVLAGISNQYDSKSDNLVFYRDVLKGLKKRKADFDVFDFHLWKGADEAHLVQEALSTYQNLLKETGFREKEIWVTEIGTHSGSPHGHPAQSEEDQASFLREALSLLMEGGVSRICLGKLIEEYGFAGNPGGYFDHTGLVYDGLGQEAAEGIPAGTPKQAYWVLQEFLPTPL